MFKRILRALGILPPEPRTILGVDRSVAEAFANKIRSAEGECSKAHAGPCKPGRIARKKAPKKRAARKKAPAKAPARKKAAR